VKIITEYRQNPSGGGGGERIPVADPKISREKKRGAPEREAPPEIKKKITYFGSQILSFTNI
jgi:hypothetical protein